MDPPVVQGLYYDFAQGRQFLVTNDTAFKLVTFLGILTVLGLDRLFRIVIRLGRRQLQTLDDGEGETSLEGKSWSSIRYGLSEAFSGRITLNSTPTRKNVLLPISVGLLGFALYAAVQIGAVASSNLQRGSTAVSSNPDSGFYSQDEPPGMGYVMRNILYEYDVQEESAHLARECYGEESTSSLCSFFLNTSIDFSIDRTTCPFSSNLCAGGVQPVRISSGAVNARVFGINAGRTIEINRTAVCSPLNMNRSYIKLIEKTNWYYSYGYFYGKDMGYPASEEATWVSRWYGSIGETPTYIVGSTLAGPTVPTWPEPLPWQPIEGLRPPNGSSVTIIFVQSQMIYHLARRDDPIFPAKSRWTDPSGLEFWINRDRTGKVMACMESNSWRDPLVSQEWLPWTLSPPREFLTRDTDKAGFYIMQRALSRSNIHWILHKRLNTALEAQKRISSSTSLPLADEQWVVEVEQLFKTSIARMHIEARNFALGTQKAYSGFVKNNNTSQLYDKVYMFNTQGWTNLNFDGFISVMVISTVLFLLAIPLGKELMIEYVFAFFTFIWNNPQETIRIIGQAIVWLWTFLVDKIAAASKAIWQQGRSLPDKLRVANNHLWIWRTAFTASVKGNIKHFR